MSDSDEEEEKKPPPPPVPIGSKVWLKIDVADWAFMLATIKGWDGVKAELSAPGYADPSVYKELSQVRRVKGEWGPWDDEAQVALK